MSHDSHPSTDAAAAIADWLDDALSDEQLAQRLAGELDRRALADARLLHELLVQLHQPRSAVTAVRIENVLAQLAPAAATPAHASYPAVPSVTTPVGTDRSWKVSAFTLAASLLLASLTWWLWQNSSRNTAFAAVEAARLEAAHAVDRQYRVLSEVQLVPERATTFESLLYQRGGEKFVLRHPSLLGQVWIGSDGRQSWFLGTAGQLRVKNDPSFATAWARHEHVGLPDLQLTALLEALTHDHQLQLLPDAPLPHDSDRVCQRLQARRRDPSPQQPAVIDLWFDPETGVARRLVLDWQRGKGERGFSKVVVDLVAEAPQPDSWYEPAAHSASPARP